MNLENAAFFDIETHRVKEWDELSNAMQKAFEHHYFNSELYDKPEDQYVEEAGLHAEFSQVICVVFGFEVGGEFKTVKTHGTDEKKILEECGKIFSLLQTQGKVLYGHAISTCDIPFMVKRYIINKMRVPDFINEFGQKPWEKAHVDTMNFWKFGMYRGVALETICAVLGIQCKSSELGGSNLHTYRIQDMPWDELIEYCKEDVVSNYTFMKEVLKWYDTE